MEVTVLVAHGHAVFSILARAQLPKVLGRLGYFVLEEFHLDAARRLSTDGDLSSRARPHVHVHRSTHTHIAHTHTYTGERQNNLEYQKHWKKLHRKTRLDFCCCRSSSVVVLQLKRRASSGQQGGKKKNEMTAGLLGYVIGTQMPKTVKLRVPKEVYLPKYKKVWCIVYYVQCADARAYRIFD